MSVRLILSNSCVQGNLIMLIWLCSYLLQELFAAVPGVSPWCWWDLGILEPSPRPHGWDGADGICRVRISEGEIRNQPGQLQAGMAAEILQ